MKRQQLRSKHRRDDGEEEEEEGANEANARQERIELCDRTDRRTHADHGISTIKISTKIFTSINQNCLSTPAAMHDQTSQHKHQNVLLSITLY